MLKILILLLPLSYYFQTAVGQSFRDNIFNCEILEDDSSAVRISLSSQLTREQKTNLSRLIIPSVVHQTNQVYTVHTLSEFGFSGNCDIREIVIDDGIRAIEKGCFSNNQSMTTISIPSSVEYIGEGVLSNCNKLSSITVDTNNQQFDSRNNCNAIVVSHSNKLIAACNKSVIPQSISIIGKKAFASCYNITSLQIPNGLRVIEAQAFKDCINLSTISIPEGCIRIDGASFDGCQSLKEVQIPSSVSEIDYNPFTDCPQLQTIKVDQRNKYFESRNNCNAIVRTIHQELVSGCYTTVIPDDVKHIKMFAFKGAYGLSEINIGDNIQQIDAGAFADTPFVSKISVSSNNKTYDSRENSNCIIETKSNRIVYGCFNSTIPQSAHSIGDYAFYGVVLPQIMYLPDNIEEIGRFSFAKSSHMDTLILPTSLKSIGSQAFSQCHELRSINIENGDILIGVGSFFECTNLSIVYLAEGIKTLPEYLFSGCTSLANVYFPVSLKSIMPSTFENCHKIIGVSNKNNDY